MLAPGETGDRKPRELTPGSKRNVYPPKSHVKQEKDLKKP
jgi:hypothetical protein